MVDDVAFRVIAGRRAWVRWRGRHTRWSEEGRHASSRDWRPFPRWAEVRILIDGEPIGDVTSITWDSRVDAGVRREAET